MFAIPFSYRYRLYFVDNDALFTLLMLMPDLPCSSWCLIYIVHVDVSFALFIFMTNFILLILLPVLPYLYWCLPYFDHIDDSLYLVHINDSLYLVHIDACFTLFILMTRFTLLVLMHDFLTTKDYVFLAHSGQNTPNTQFCTDILSRWIWKGVISHK